MENKNHETQQAGSEKVSKPRPVKPSKKKRQGGFSLIELLVVVAIILIIAAIAIPSLLKAKVAARNSSAVADLRTLNTAEAMYSAEQNPSKFGLPAALGTAGQIDTTFASGLRDGYNFTVTVVAAPAGYSVNAVPVSTDPSANSYCSDDSMVIRVGTGCAAGGGGAGVVVGQ